MGGNLSTTILPERESDRLAVAAVGLRPVMKLQPVQEGKNLPEKKDEQKKETERKDTTQQTVDELQNKCGF